MDLFEFDESSGALLLQAAVPGTSLEEHGNRPEAITIGGALLRRPRRPAPTSTRSPWLRTWLSTRALDAVPHAEARSLLSLAASMASELCHPVANPVLVNRDRHLGSVLVARREPCLLVAPGR